MQPSSSHLCRQHETTVTPIEKVLLVNFNHYSATANNRVQTLSFFPPLNGGGTSSHSW